MLKAGKFDRCYFDNGKQYVAKQLKFSLARLGIHITHAPVQSGKSKGKIEKFHQVVDAFLNEFKLEKDQTLDNLNQKWTLYLEEYYHNAPHSGIAENYECMGSPVPENSLPKEKYILLYLSDSKLTPKWFYKGLLEQLGMESGFYRGDAKKQFQQAIEIIQGVQKRCVVCVLDEAHLLDKEMLEEFRFMLNYKFDSESPMALVLVGQTELWTRKLKLKSYASIRQRIDMYCILLPLDCAECGEYIRSHQGYAGCTKDIFTETAIDKVYQISASVPLIINRVCEKALMYAYQKQKINKIAGKCYRGSRKTCWIVKDF